ncbi:MAG: hypothetical protein HQL77_03930 [Magnetococcales bacterium]|nr:hypothetical protein [Magnetococcales bacterium]
MYHHGGIAFTRQEQIYRAMVRSGLDAHDRKESIKFGLKVRQERSKFHQRLRWLHDSGLWRLFAVQTPWAIIQKGGP